MKQATKRIISLVALTTVAACVDLDEPLVSGVSSDFYADPQGVEAAVTATYSSLRGWYLQPLSIWLGDYGTDLWNEGDQGGEKYYHRYDPAFNASVPGIRIGWTNLYRGINTANAMLDRADRIKGMDPAIRERRIAEVRYLRAFFYFRLVQTWGDIPLLLTENKGIVTEMTRDPAADVYDAIVADLEHASAALPLTQPDYGRATKGAAQHLLAKVLLTRAYKDYAGSDDFSRAAQLAEEVIGSGVYALQSDFADVFDIHNQGHSEVIFPVQSSYDPQAHGNEGSVYHLWYLSLYDDLPGLPRSLKHGRPFRQLRPSVYALALWDQEKDTRFEDSFQTVWDATAPATGGAGTSGGPIAVGDTALWLAPFDVTDEFRASKPYRIFGYSEWNDDFQEFRYPSLKKHQDPLRASINERFAGREYMFARLAETHLIAAEAYLGAGNPGAAVPHLNTIRRRAARPGFEAAMEVSAADVTLDFILEERGRELIGEVDRWFDLVRTGTFLERVTAYNPKATGVQAHHALRPIPQVQIDAVTGGASAFPQNPGY